MNVPRIGSHDWFQVIDMQHRSSYQNSMLWPWQTSAWGLCNATCMMSALEANIQPEYHCWMRDIAMHLAWTPSWYGVCSSWCDSGPLTTHLQTSLISEHYGHVILVVLHPLMFCVCILMGLTSTNMRIRPHTSTGTKLIKIGGTFIWVWGHAISPFPHLIWKLLNLSRMASNTHTRKQTSTALV